MHGYYRTTQDLDIWVNKTPDNYTKLKKAFAIFGMRMFDLTENNFMGEDFDVFTIGRKPLQIDILTKLKGVEFEDAFKNTNYRNIEGLDVRYLHISDLIKAKTAAGRHKDLDDIEKLSQI
ncbi:MAG: hypothetical protein H7Y86_04460 [Rhizobacter sp.]|nr:hypothetical protein [Ferruginibacter sp.]